MIGNKDIPDDFFQYLHTNGPNLPKVYKWFLNSDLRFPATMDEIADEAGISRSSIPNCIMRLQILNMIQKHPEGNTYRYTLVPQTEWEHRRRK